MTRGETGRRGPVYSRDDSEPSAPRPQPAAPRTPQWGPARGCSRGSHCGTPPLWEKRWAGTQPAGLAAQVASSAAFGQRGGLGPVVPHEGSVEKPELGSSGLGVRRFGLRLFFCGVAGSQAGPLWVGVGGHPSSISELVL